MAKGGKVAFKPGKPNRDWGSCQKRGLFLKIEMNLVFSNLFYQEPNYWRTEM